MPALEPVRELAIGVKARQVDEEDDGVGRKLIHPALDPVLVELLGRAVNERDLAPRALEERGQIEEREVRHGRVRRVVPVGLSGGPVRHAEPAGEVTLHVEAGGTRRLDDQDACVGHRLTPFLESGGRNGGRIVGWCRTETSEPSWS